MSKNKNYSLKTISQYKLFSNVLMLFLYNCVFTSIVMIIHNVDNGFSYLIDDFESSLMNKLGLMFFIDNQV